MRNDQYALNGRFIGRAVCFNENGKDRGYCTVIAFKCEDGRTHNVFYFEPTGEFIYETYGNLEERLIKNYRGRNYIARYVVVDDYGDSHEYFIGLVKKQ